MPSFSRRLTLAASVLLLGAFVFPLWRIDLEAPQYPEGIGMLIRVHTVDGLKENDLNNINGLNHYIGMKEIRPDAIPELTYMPWILATLVATGLLTAAVNRRGALAAWVAAFALTCVAGLYDFWRWGYDYGHDLDPQAIIQVPGMVYQPPLIGSKQLLNFTAHSWPGLGGVLLGVSLGLGALALLVAFRRPAAPAAIAAAALLAACAPAGPRPIAYDEEACGYCRMTISDPRFGAEARTSTGRVHTFDSIECLAAYVHGAGAERLEGVWVSDFEHPGTFVAADSATFWRVGGGVSPMGKGLLATVHGRHPVGMADVGEPMSWSEVVELVAREGMHARVEASDVVVSPYGEVRTVAEGVRRAAPGARVLVLAGAYREPTVVVDKPLTIEGRGWPTLDGEGQRALMLVVADDVTVRGMRFARVGVSMTEDRAALRVSEARRCTIAGNRFDDTFFGVYLAKVDGCRIADNEFAGPGARATETTSGNAVHLWSARDVDVVGNRIAGHRDGIYFEFVRHGRVAGNVSEDNIRYGLHFMYSDSSRYERNTFRRNGSGVAVMYTRVVEMTGNHFVDNRGGAAYGLLLKEIGDPVLRGNTFARNTVALMADGTTRLVAEDNQFGDNGWGIRLLANVQESRVMRNDFTGNTFDVTTNGRAGDGAALADNYFQEYGGYDLDRDGRGDVPHRPVRLSSLLVERWDAALVLQRSFFVGLLDASERLLPVLTPERLVDARPAMRPIAGAGHGMHAAREAR